jgi:hypothetical protein
MRFARSVQAARDRDYSGIDSYGQQGTGQNERESTAGTRNTSLLLIQIFFWLFSVIYETIWSSPGLSIGLLVALLRSYPMLDQYYLCKWVARANNQRRRVLLEMAEFGCIRTLPYETRQRRR